MECLPFTIQITMEKSCWCKSLWESLHFKNAFSEVLYKNASKIIAQRNIKTPKVYFVLLAWN